MADGPPQRTGFRVGVGVSVIVAVGVIVEVGVTVGDAVGVAVGTLRGLNNPQLIPNERSIMHASSFDIRLREVCTVRFIDGMGVIQWARSGGTR